MEKEEFETYTEQTETQKELIRCRYEFGLNEVKLKLPPGVEVKDVTWVDIGSNLGIGVSSIAKESGIIASDKEIEYLSQYDTDIPRIVLDGAHLPFAKGSCKVISCLETIEHLPMADVNSMLDEIYRVLDNDGIFLISTPNKDANGKAKMSPDHEQEFSYMELHMLLRNHGFKVYEEYGQSFIKEDNLLHQGFRSLRENYLIRNIYYRLPSFFVKAVREKSLNAFGNGEVRKKRHGEIERLMYFICSKVT